MTDTCKQTDIDKNVIWNQISAFLAIQLLPMANSPELAAKYINPQCDGQAVLTGNTIRALFTSCFDVTIERGQGHVRAVCESDSFTSNRSIRKVFFLFFLYNKFPLSDIEKGCL